MLISVSFSVQSNREQGSVSNPWCQNLLAWGQPSGSAVKCTRSALASRGLPVRIPGADMALLGKPRCGRRPTYKVEEDGQGCELGASLP